MTVAIGISLTRCNKIRRGFEGSESGLASIAALRATRRSLKTQESKTGEVNGSGGVICCTK